LCLVPTVVAARSAVHVSALVAHLLAGCSRCSPHVQFRPAWLRQRAIPLVRDCAL